MFPYTPLTDCFFCNRDVECLLRGTDWVFVIPRITGLTQFEASQAVTLHRVSRHLIGVLVTLLALTSCFWCTQETREVIQIFKLALTSGVRV